MASQAVCSEVAATIDGLVAGYERLAELESLVADADDAKVVVAEVAALGRRQRALEAALLGEIERRGLHRVDGHVSAKVFVRHHGQLSDGAALRLDRASAALADLPAVAAAYRAGELPSDHVDAIARVYANPRVRTQLIAEDERLARLAPGLSYRVFTARLRAWERQVDEDGTCDRAERTHANRNASILPDYDGAWELLGSFGSVQGARMADVHRGYERLEWLADWERARAEHGDAATVEHLARTDRQRRADALYAIFEAAADHLGMQAGGARIITNLLLDQATFERQLRRLQGLPNPPLAPEFGEDTGYRCSTIDGTPVDPTEATVTALTEHVRRVVVDGASSVIDLGRQQRLFTGSAQLAVKLSSTHCIWPGCNHPATTCQSDHIQPWHSPRAGPPGRDGPPGTDPPGADPPQGGGATDPSNGANLCPRHNRLKNHGYTTHREPDGTWHITRPDGGAVT